MAKKCFDLCCTKKPALEDAMLPENRRFLNPTVYPVTVNGMPADIRGNVKLKLINLGMTRIPEKYIEFLGVQVLHMK